MNVQDLLNYLTPLKRYNSKNSVVCVK